MLANLTIRDVVLIDALSVDFSPGLTVLTGETGAGKSILLDSLSLALGARGDAGLVRAGAGKGQVIATFELPDEHPARALLQENGIEADGPLILRRQQSSDGKTRAFVNDQPVSATMMRAVGTMLVEIHGQHDDRALIDAAVHRRLLDAYGRLEPDAEEVAWLHTGLRDAMREKARLAASIADAERERDYLAAAVEELDALSPEPGEENSLAERRQRLMQAEKIAGDLNDAYESIGGAHSPIPELAATARRLERKAADAPGLLDATLEGINEALDALERARDGLDEVLRAAEFEPRELEEAEERLFALRAAARKHQVMVDDLPALAAEMSAKLADIVSGAERLAGLDQRERDARERYCKAAAALSSKRADAAKNLAAAVNAELPALKLERARFIVDQQVGEGEETPDGFDTIEFHVRTNPGTRPGPMMRVASGGELSRFLLALKVVLADKGSAPTLVFDEIDTGVGGAVAEAIGLRLGRLSERVQVLSVTHAPQVAARADAHLLISKRARERGKRVATEVGALAEGARREEIARMLAGSVITDEARAAADRLLRYDAKAA